MRTLLSVLVLPLVLSLATPALAGPADPWTIDPARSRIAFTVEQVGKITTGRIGSWNGTIVFDPQALRAAHVDIRMDMRTAGTGTKDVDDTMRGPDFLDVGSQPEARFISTNLVSRGGDNYEALGKLTLRGVTRDAAVLFWLKQDAHQASAHGSLELKRLDYGVGRNQWASTTFVADLITIEIAVVASRP